MKYIAIVDDNFLSNFRVDAGMDGKVLVCHDKRGLERGVVLKPLNMSVFTSQDGISMYLTQEQLDELGAYFQEKALKECAKEIEEQFVKSLLSFKDIEKQFYKPIPIITPIDINKVVKLEMEENKDE